MSLHPPPVIRLRKGPGRVYGGTNTSSTACSRLGALLNEAFAVSIFGGPSIHWARQARVALKLEAYVFRLGWVGSDVRA